jgi:hypothetical protein
MLSLDACWPSLPSGNGSCALDSTICHQVLSFNLSRYIECTVLTLCLIVNLFASSDLRPQMKCLLQMSF